MSGGTHSLQNYIMIKGTYKFELKHHFLIQYALVFDCKQLNQIKLPKNVIERVLTTDHKCVDE